MRWRRSSPPNARRNWRSGFGRARIDAGRDPSEVEIGSYLLTVVTKDTEAGRKMVKEHMAWYVGSFTRYEHLMLESGFEEASLAARAWQDGNREGAARAPLR